LLPRPELVDPGHRRDHAQPDVEEHRHLRDVGRLRRLLRPRAAAPGGRVRAGHPGAVAGDLAVREDRRGRPPPGRVLERAAVHRGPLGALAADRPRPPGHGSLLRLQLRQEAAPSRPVAPANRLLTPAAGGPRWPPFRAGPGRLSVMPPDTIAELRAAGYPDRTVKEE